MSYDDKIREEICNNCIIRYDCTADKPHLCLSVNKNLDLLKREIREAVLETIQATEIHEFWVDRITIALKKRNIKE